MSSIPPSIPLRLANAYGTAAPSRGPAPGSAPSSAPSSAKPELSRTEPKPAPRSGTDADGRAARLADLATLVRAPVQKAANPKPAAAEPGRTEPLPFYTNPVERNAAATRIVAASLGRSLDTSA
ncbi:MAG: hypothetical protein AAFR38_09730 [Planctomycetota bacterium]